MTNFTQQIDNPYGVDTYENVKKTYDWIHNTLKKGRFVPGFITSEFLFDIGAITCSCKNIRDFIENAYGQENYHHITMSINQISLLTRKAIFIYVETENIRVSATDKQVLDNVVKSLKKGPDEAAPKQTKLGQWIEGIMQGLLTNGIWAILAALCAAIAAFLFN